MPPMNFLPGELQQDGSDMRLVGDGFSIALSDEDAALAKQHGSNRVILGIRPSDLDHDADAPDGRSIELDVVVSEYIGAQSVLICQCGSQKVVVEVKSETPIALGQKLRFSINQAAIHLFDQESESSLKHT